MSGPGSPQWLEEMTKRAAESGGRHQGPAYTIEVVIAGAPDGPRTYHVVLEDGSPPTFAPGSAASGAPQASLEQVWDDVVARAEGDVPAVVGYMRGTTKTKGATRPVYELFRLLAR